MARRLPFRKPGRLLAGHLKSSYMAGFTFFAPMIVFYLAYRYVFIPVDRVLQPAIGLSLGQSLPGAGFLAMMVLVYLFGVVAATRKGRKLLHFAQKPLRHVPVLGGLYGTAKELTELLTSEKESCFKRVVAVEYPRKGLWALGFATGTFEDEHEMKMTVVFIPNGPIPSAGSIAILPAEDVLETDMTVESALKLIVSGGTLSPASVSKWTSRTAFPPLPHRLPRIVVERATVATSRAK